MKSDIAITHGIRVSADASVELRRRGEAGGAIGGIGGTGGIFGVMQLVAIIFGRKKM